MILKCQNGNPNINPHKQKCMYISKYIYDISWNSCHTSFATYHICACACHTLQFHYMHPSIFLEKLSGGSSKPGRFSPRSTSKDWFATCSLRLPLPTLRGLRVPLAVLAAKALAFGESFTLGLVFCAFLALVLAAGFGGLAGGPPLSSTVAKAWSSLRLTPPTNFSFNAADFALACSSFFFRLCQSFCCCCFLLGVGFLLLSLSFFLSLLIQFPF